MDSGNVIQFPKTPSARVVLGQLLDEMDRWIITAISEEQWIKRNVLVQISRLIYEKQKELNDR